MSQRFRVVITDFITDDLAPERQLLGEIADLVALNAADEPDLLGQVDDADALMMYHNVTISKGTIDRLQHCKLIVRCGVGYDNIDWRHARTRGIPVANVPDYGTEEVADSAIGLMLTLTRGIHLQSLVLNDNKIKDVTPLGGLKALQHLELSNNEIEKIDALSGLPALSSLYLNGNKIADCGPAGKLTKLSSLELGKNQIKDISPLAALTKLRLLAISDNAVADVAALGKMTDLSLLMMSRCKVTDLTPLVKACEADAAGPKRFAPYLRLYLGGNPLSDAAKKDQIAALKKIGVRVFEE